VRLASLSTIAAATAGLTAAALLAAGSAGAAISPAYTVTGLEIAATSTQGSFVGTGTGSTGDALAWSAVVQHTVLSMNPATPATITGGSLNALSLGGGAASLTGTFTGGSVTYDPTLSSPATCGNQVYDVVGSLALASGGATGTGVFQVTLTHLRISLFGRCVTIGASVTGAPGLTIAQL
jgi:hypothetical protein